MATLAGIAFRSRCVLGTFWSTQPAYRVEPTKQAILVDGKTVQRLVHGELAAKDVADEVIYPLFSHLSKITDARRRQGGSLDFAEVTTNRDHSLKCSSCRRVHQL